MFISGIEARELVKNGGILVDVRGPEEFQQVSAPDAVNIPLQHLPQLAQKHLHPEKPVVVYCLSGMRSAQAQAVLRQMGYANVHNVGTLQNYMQG